MLFLLLKQRLNWSLPMKNWQTPWPPTSRSNGSGPFNRTDPPLSRRPACPWSRATDSPAECLLRGRPSPSPKQFQAELDLARFGGGARDYAGGWGTAPWG